MNYTETIDLIVRNTGTQNTTTSSYPIAAKTVDINNTLNWYFVLANMGAGNLRPADDTNQADYPIVYFDLVADQNDYTFTVDENGNQIMGIDKVRITLPDGVTKRTLRQINKDQADDEYLHPTTSGVPEYYYITANGIFIVNPSNYNMTDGGELHISRTPTYFTTSDTTKMAGIPWVHHEYLALRPSFLFASQKGLSNANDLKEMLYGKDGRSGMEGAIKKYWRDNNRSFSMQITAEPVNSI